ncbi:hypothetical protein M0804_003563 [Polistes exclamans]|nr:hypothetical protein M0804_003563 [Polistes exclamans]
MYPSAGINAAAVAVAAAARHPGPPQPGQPFKFTVNESCDRIKEEFSFLQAQYHTLKMECEKLATDKIEIQRHYVMLMILRASGAHRFTEVTLLLLWVSNDKLIRRNGRPLSNGCGSQQASKQAGRQASKQASKLATSVERRSVAVLFSAHDVFLFCVRKS